MSQCLPAWRDGRHWYFNIMSNSRPLSNREANAHSLAGLFTQRAVRDSPARLPRVQVPQLSESDHPGNPANFPLDTLTNEWVRGTVSLTRPSHPEDEDSIWLPKTQGGAPMWLSTFFEDRVGCRASHRGAWRTGRRSGGVQGR